MGRRRKEYRRGENTIFETADEPASLSVSCAGNQCRGVLHGGAKYPEDEFN